MPSTLVELRPERRLLDPNFEGYKLSLSSLAHWTHTLSPGVERLYPNEAQYSFIHAKLFALHNHLQVDKFDYRPSCYYIDTNWSVQRINFDQETCQFQAEKVYQLTSYVERQPGHYNSSLSFVSHEYAVLSDGTGTLHIVKTGNRSKSTQIWVTEYTHEMLGPDKCFLITDARVDVIHNHVQIEILLQSIEQTDKQFDTHLNWFTLLYDGVKDWKIISQKQLKGKGVVHYAAIERGGNAVYIASDNTFKYVSDSVKDIAEETRPLERKILYTWLQTTEDVTLTFQLPAIFDKDLLHISVGVKNIKVSYAETQFVDGVLKGKVDSDLTTWNVDDTGKVDMLLTKCDNSHWSDLIEGGDASGEQILDANLVEEAHRRLAHLCSDTELTAESTPPAYSNLQLEECDAVSEEDTTLVRLDGNSHKATHLAPLSVHQFLFSVTLEPTEAPAIALRHDVDACIWQPYQSQNDNQLWPVKHRGTAMAFGYIQSSKQNKKFTTCSPDFSYSVVCESDKYVFVYRMGGDTKEGCQLRQRNLSGDTKIVKVGQQQVFNLDKYGQVLGIHASNQILFILTDSCLLALEVM